MIGYLAETNIIDLLIRFEFAKSRSEAKRLVEQGSVELTPFFGALTFKVPSRDYIVKTLIGTHLKIGKYRCALFECYEDPPWPKEYEYYWIVWDLRSGAKKIVA